MAKLIDVLKSVFGDNLDAEVNLDGEDKDKKKEKKDDTKDGDNKDDKGKGINITINSASGKKEEDDSKKDGKDGKETKQEKKEDEPVSIFGEGWLDKSTGKIDTSKITNKEVADALSALVQVYSSKTEQQKLDEAIMEAVKKEKLAVKPETVVSLLDKTSIKLVDGKVYGVDTSLEALKKSEPGLFINKGKASSPLTEGFDPVNKASTDSVAPKSLMEAVAMESAMSEQQ